MKSPKNEPKCRVVLATNTFENVPVILQYDKQPIISVDFSDTVLKFAFYSNDGKKIADIIGEEIHLCDAEDNNLTLSPKTSLKKIYKVNYNGKIVIQVKQNSATDFEVQEAELFMPDGYKITISKGCEIEVINKNGKKIGNSRVIMANNTFIKVPIGVFVQKDGTINIGVFQLP